MARVTLELPEKFAFETELSLRITDINYGNHLGNAELLGLLHEARIRFLRSHAMSELDVGGCGLIMTDAVIVYKAQAVYGDVLRIQVAVRDVGSVGCDLVYRVTNRATDGEVARAKTGIVCFDYAAGKVVRCPEKFRALFPA